MRGKADTFYPFDLRQELNNLAIKVGNFVFGAYRMTLANIGTWSTSKWLHLGITP